MTKSVGGHYIHGICHIRADNKVSVSIFQAEVKFRECTFAVSRGLCAWQPTRYRGFVQRIGRKSLRGKGLPVGLGFRGFSNRHSVYRHFSTAIPYIKRSFSSATFSTYQSALSSNVSRVTRALREESRPEGERGVRRWRSKYAGIRSNNALAGGYGTGRLSY